VKRCFSMLLAVVLLLACVNIAPITAHAAKDEPKRAISVVFDNSGSMYEKNNKAWCRATYAMEVFAAMLNEGDELQIFPMNPITVGSTRYTMETPLVIKNPKEGVEKIHQIFTPHEDWKKEKDATRTHIESIDHAAQGLEKMNGDQKYLIILTDGTNFYENNKDLAGNSKKALETRLSALADKQTMKVMYLGIDKDATMPVVKSDYYVSKKAQNSADVLATLTELCNQIFGRDSLPANYIPGKSVNFDLSMKKLIVFVQGENIDRLQVTDESGAPVGKLVSTQQTKYSTKGTGKASLDNNPDTSLQGMIVTYEDCDAGNYNIQFLGTQSSIEVYYEPNADLSFVFTDAAGKNVDPKALYEGDYKVSFGMKDGKTGRLIESELLGKPSYKGSYTLNGKAVPITAEGYSGEIPVTLNVDDKFKADLTVTYLSGYTISKDSSDFGWPEGGIKVVSRPAGELTMKLEGGQNNYPLQKLQEGEPFKLTFFYQGKQETQPKQLTGEQLQKVTIKIDEEMSNAAITLKKEDDHILLTLGYKDPNAPQNTKTGSCTVPITAFYEAKGSTAAQAEDLLRYHIDDDFARLQMDMYTLEDYIVISQMDTAEPVTIDLLLDGKPLTEEQFKTVKLTVDCGGLEYELKPDAQNSRYQVVLKHNDSIAEGQYPVTATAEYTDKVGRTTQQYDEVSLTLSKTALWKKVLCWILGILAAIGLIILICRIPAMPSPRKTGVKEGDSKLVVATKPVEATYDASLGGGELAAETTYAGKTFGVSISDLKAGPGSFISTPHEKRSMLVSVPDCVTTSGVGAKITEISIAGNRFVQDPVSHSFVPASPKNLPFTITHGDKIKYQGTITMQGTTKQFMATHRITFK